MICKVHEMGYAAVAHRSQQPLCSPEFLRWCKSIGSSIIAAELVVAAVKHCFTLKDGVLQSMPYK